jgi:hypothetical protein
MNYLITLLFFIILYLFILKNISIQEKFMSFRPWKNYEKIKNSNLKNDSDIDSDNDSISDNFYKIIINNNYELIDNKDKCIAKVNGNFDISKFKININCDNNKNIEIKLIKDFNDYFVFNFDSNNYKIILQNGLKIIKNEFDNYDILILDNKINFNDSGYSIGYIKNNSIYNNTNISENYYIMFIFYILYNEIRENKKDYDKLLQSIDD